MREWLRRHSPLLAGFCLQAFVAPTLDGITLTLKDDDDSSLVHRTLHGIVLIAPHAVRRHRRDEWETKGLYVAWARSPVLPLWRPRRRSGTRQHE